MSYRKSEMDYAPEEMSFFLATRKATLSPKALSTLRVMAFLDPKRIHDSLFEPLGQHIAAKIKGPNIQFPTSALEMKEACAELMNVSLILSIADDKAYTMNPEIQTSVLADTQKDGLIAPLFKVIVGVLEEQWPQMVCVPDRTIDQEQFQAATAPGTDYEEYLIQRYTQSRLPLLGEYIRYAKSSVWGSRDELVHHIARLEQIFHHADDVMVEVCATVKFAMLLAEASWYYFERSRYHDANVKIQSALGVYELGQDNSSIHHATIYRLHAAIALEHGKYNDAAEYVKMQVQQLGLHNTAQGVALRESGLLDRAPDSISSSSWAHDVPPGKFVVLPFRSVCNFGFKLYLSAGDEKKHKDPLWLLEETKKCFSAALADCESANVKSARMNLRIAELHYALGNVAHKNAIYLGSSYFKISLEHFDNALSHFQIAMTANTQISSGMAKTYYKLAAQHIHIHHYKNAMRFLDKAEQFYKSDAAYIPHLARVVFQRSRVQHLTRDMGEMKTYFDAFALRAAIRGAIKAEDKPYEDKLTEADFDELVGIWER